MMQGELKTQPNGVGVVDRGLCAWLGGVYTDIDGQEKRVEYNKIIMFYMRN